MTTEATKASQEQISSAGPDVQVPLADIVEEDSSEIQTPQSSDIQTTVSASREFDEDFYGNDEGSDLEKTPEPVDDDTFYDTDLEIEESKSEYHSLSHEKIYIETCKELGIVPASYFLRHINDEILHMPHHGLGPAGAKALAVPLISNTRVLTLNIEDNWIESLGAIYIAEMMKENCYIAELNLSENKIDDEGAAAVFDMLQYNSSLELLNLSGNMITDSISPVIAAALLDSCRIKHLSLSHSRLGKLAGEVLGHAIGENETLETIDLSWNLLRGKAGADIIDGLKVNSRLKSANVSWNGMGNECALPIAECLKNNHVLTELDVSNNRINLQGIAVIAKGLDANEDLKILKIGCNPMGSVGAMLLLNAIYNERSTLKVLDLKDVEVEKEFDQISKDILQAREDVQILHAGILSNYIIKGSGKKINPEGDEAEKLPEETFEGD